MMAHIHDPHVYSVSKSASVVWGVMLLHLAVDRSTSNYLGRACRYDSHDFIIHHHSFSISSADIHRFDSAHDFQSGIHGYPPPCLQLNLYEILHINHSNMRHEGELRGFLKAATELDQDPTTLSVLTSEALTEHETCVEGSNWPSMITASLAWLVIYGSWDGMIPCDRTHGR